MGGVPRPRLGANVTPAKDGARVVGGDGEDDGGLVWHVTPKVMVPRTSSSMKRTVKMMTPPAGSGVTATRTLALGPQESSPPTWSPPPERTSPSIPSMAMMVVLPGGMLLSAAVPQVSTTRLKFAMFGTAVNSQAAS